MLDFNEKKTALVIIDVQNDYFPKGLNPLYKSNEALKNVKKLLEHFRNQNQTIIHIRHISTSENAAFFKPNSQGSEIHSSLKPRENEAVVVKHWADSFYKTDLHEILKEKEIDRLVVCGMMSHHCVDTTVRSGSTQYDIILVHDACATKDLVFEDEVIEAEIVQKTFMASLKGFATVLNTLAWIE